VAGEPEDQLRALFEKLVDSMAERSGFAPGVMVTIGEASVAALHTRPDPALAVHGALVDLRN
jgi:hypothetical protein